MTRPHSQFFNPQDSQETKFNGQSRLSNNVQVDGLDNNHKTGLLTVMIPSAEAIDSVNVATSQLRRGVRPRGRLGDHGRPEVGHEPAQGHRASSSATPRPRRRRTTSRPRPPRSRRRSTSSSGPPSAGRSSRTSSSSSPTTSAPWTTSASSAASRSRPAEWRNGDFSTATTTIYDPADRQPRRHRPAAVPGQRHSREPDQPGRPQHPGAWCRSRTSPAPLPARSTTSCRAASARRRRTRSTSS